MNTSETDRRTLCRRPSRRTPIYAAVLVVLVVALVLGLSASAMAAPSYIGNVGSWIGQEHDRHDDGDHSERSRCRG